MSLENKNLASPYERFEDYLRYERKYSKFTIINYLTDLQQWARFMKESFALDVLGSPADIRQIKYAMLRDWMMSLQKEEGYKRSSQNRKTSALRSYIKRLIQWEIIEIDPIARLPKLKKEKRLPTFVPVEKIDKVFESQDEAPSEPKEQYSQALEFAILETIYGCGLRRSEVIGLKYENINFIKKNLKVLGKGKKERMIPFGDHVLNALKEYQAKCDFLGIDYKTQTFFRTLKGAPIYETLVYNLVKNKLKTVGDLNKTSPHVLRHTYATHLLDAGADLNAIKELLGHSSLAATQVYLHNTLVKLKAVHAQAHPHGDGKPEDQPETAAQLEDN